MDDHLLQGVDHVLNDSLTNVNALFAGRVLQMYDPQARRPALLWTDTATGKPARYTIDTLHYDVQVAHRLMGGQPIKNPSHWGSRQEIAFDLDWTLICATKRPDIMTSFLLAFTRISDIDVRDFNTDSLAVLKNEFLFVPDQTKPYDPLLTCFAIRYRMLNISESVFQSLTNSIAHL